jgi:hypothetical protein
MQINIPMLPSIKIPIKNLIDKIQRGKLRLALYASFVK